MLPSLPRFTPRPARALSAAGLGVVAAAALGACGGSAASGDSESQRERVERAELAFARCMRENGVDVPDPQVGRGGGQVALRLEKDQDAAAFQRGHRACRRHLEGVIKEPSEAEKTRFRDAAVKFAECMRRNGVDLPDPGSDGGAVMVEPGPGAGPSSETPRFRRAEERCRDLLPDLRREGPAGAEVRP